MKRKKKIYPLILSGGVGSRLWPLSNKNLPKQFLNIKSKDSLLIETTKRLKNSLYMPATFIGSYDHRFLIKNNLDKEKIIYDSILLEPTPKNTMASITLGALKISEKDSNAIIIVLPADQIIEKKKEFNSEVQKIVNACDLKSIYTFGIKPNSPSSEFGYIKKGKIINSKNNIYKISSFSEKPNSDLAKKYLETGDWFWNSGIFIFSLKALLDEIELCSSKLLNNFVDIYNERKSDLFFEFFNSKKFLSLKTDSFDREIMEKTKNGYVKPINIGWTDIGNWKSFSKFLAKDKNKNTLNQKNILVNKVNNSLIYSTNKEKKILAIGLSDMIIIEHHDSLLVSKTKDSHKLKKIIERSNNNDFFDKSSNVFYRPWGEYKNIYCEDEFLVKVLTVYPKSQISLQYHKRRSEHWVITRGIATITKGKKKFKLKPNESTYIEKNQIHRIENTTNEPMVMVEVQVGKNISEEDIIRLDDIYGRKVN